MEYKLVINGTEIIEANSEKIITAFVKGSDEYVDFWEYYTDGKKSAGSKTINAGYDLNCFFVEDDGQHAAYAN